MTLNPDFHTQLNYQLRVYTFTFTYGLKNTSPTNIWKLLEAILQKTREKRFINTASKKPQPLARTAEVQHDCDGG